jgi:hypothetical protein
VASVVWFNTSCPIFNEGVKMAMVRDLNLTIARRVRVIRLELFGPHGVPTLAEALGIPEQTWANYESGVALPGPIVLTLIERTGVNPHWLLTGKGERYTAKRCGDQSGQAEGP